MILDQVLRSHDAHVIWDLKFMKEILGLGHSGVPKSIEILYKQIYW